MNGINVDRVLVSYGHTQIDNGEHDKHNIYGDFREIKDAPGNVAILAISYINDFHK